MEFLKCDTSDPLTPVCASDAQITDLLNKLYINMYTLEEMLDFEDKDKYGGRPVTTVRKLRYQYQLEHGKSVFQFVGVRPNRVKAKDHRLFFWEDYQEFDFLDGTTTLSYSASTYMDTSNSSTDDITYAETTRYNLGGTYFFLSENVYYHTRQAYNTFDIISDFGGLVGAIFTSIAYFSRFFINFI